MVLLVLSLVEFEQLELTIEVADIRNGLLLAGIISQQCSVFLPDILHTVGMVGRLLLSSGWVIRGWLLLPARLHLRN